MAMRIVALLIPLAIILPQLHASRPPAAAPQDAVQVQPAPVWSYDTRRGADAAVTRVVLDAPAHDAIRTLDSPAPVAALTASAAMVRKAPLPRAAPKLVRSASLVTGTPLTVASSRLHSRHFKRLALGAGCEPGAHCAPVEDAKVTLVARRAL